jgi:hypothetical protein
MIEPNFRQDFVSVAPSGLVGSCTPTHGLRRGLHSFAASRLALVLAVPGSVSAS